MIIDTTANRGVVVAVRGSVVDIRFVEQLPPINSVLHTGDQGCIVIEVLGQLDAYHVRGIALTPTQGLSRGMAVIDTGGPLKAPVGKGILSRMFDVFGNTIDREPPLTDVQWRSVHSPPPPLAQRSTKSEIFETGIKVIDVLVPLERGGKAGLFGGAGVGKTVLLTELIDNIVARARRLERFLTQPFFTTEQFTGRAGKLVSLQDTLDGCERILHDEFKDYSERALYMIGAIDEAKRPAKSADNDSPELQSQVAVGSRYES